VPEASGKNDLADRFWMHEKMTLSGKTLTLAEKVKQGKVEKL
jgi:hypothetical protein